MAINNRENARYFNNSEGRRYLGRALAGALAASIPGHAGADTGLKCEPGKNDRGELISGTQTFPTVSGAKETVGLTFKALPDDYGNPHIKSYTIETGQLKGTQIVGNAREQVMFVYSPIHKSAILFDYSSFPGHPLNPDIQPGLNFIMANQGPLDSGRFTPLSPQPITAIKHAKCNSLAEINPDSFSILSIPKGATIVDLRTSNKPAEILTAQKRMPAPTQGMAD